MPVDLDLPPPPTISEPRGGDGGWVELVTASNDIDAHLLTGRLNEAGIDTGTIKDRSAPGAWLYGGSNPWAPVMILVRAFQLDDARLILAEVALEGPGAAAPPAEDRPGAVMWWTLALALGILLTGLALAQTALGVLAGS